MAAIFIRNSNANNPQSKVVIPTTGNRPKTKPNERDSASL